jgi:hypothetical protein
MLRATFPGAISTMANTNIETRNMVNNMVSNRRTMYLAIGFSVGYGMKKDLTGFKRILLDSGHDETCQVCIFLFYF